MQNKKIKMRKKYNLQKSFTLVESIIAISIIAIAFTAITQLFPLSLKIENSAEMKSRAIELAQAKIEEFFVNSYSEIKCQQTSPPCEIEENQVPEDSAFKRVTRITFVNPSNNFSESGSDTGIKKVEVTLYWKTNFSQGEDSFKIVTLFAQK